MPRVYNEGNPSTIGTQLQTYYYEKKALIDLVKEQYFTPFASTIGMPKHFGKKIKRYLYIPLLDDRNTNDQGIDAAGAILNATLWYAFIDGAKVVDAIVIANEAGFATEALCRAAVAAAVTATTIDQATADTYGITLGLGNLYGSSKDVGTIASKLPALSETGGRVNRVGFKRIEIEGTFEKFGFFDEYTQESLDFDTDAELSQHINREMLRGAGEITEDALQIDLLNAPGVIRFPGTATTMAEISGETGAVTEVTYSDLSAMAIDLDNNRASKDTKIITGTRLTDTKVVQATRALLIGSEMLPTFERMTDHFGNEAFIKTAHYASGTTLLNGEEGSVGRFRIVVVPEMMHWAGAGGAVTTNDGYMEENSKYNVYPMLFLGSEAFTTIGFQTNGKTNKFKIKHAKPGSTESYARDVYGETGFMSIKWYYGSMILRPEWMAIMYSVGRV